MQKSTSENLADIDFASLLDLAEDDLSFLKEKPAEALGEKYVVFALDEEFYAVHSNLVAEVLSPLPVTPLPGVPVWLSGVANLRGEIISVVDLRKFWKKKPAADLDASSPQKNKLIVLRSSKDETKIAFIIDRLSEIVTLAPRDIKFSAADFENSFPTLFGKAAHESVTLLLFDAENLLSSLTLSELQSY
ncbi:MAG TPA: chemotaxis protein CheW [Pyrinomonadaceae bacterium]|nr:chemotaxis protein CheW [Pyrinomonadaceae bacterium]